MLKLMMTSAVVLAVTSPAFAQQADGDEMRSLTSNILAGLSNSAAMPASAEVSSPEELQSLVQQALVEGQSDAYLEALIGEAAANGSIVVSDSMRTTDGDVDTRTLLASLIAKSTNDAPAELVAEVQADQREDQYYVVQAGDSLAAIALTYYDSAQDYTRIFEANRDQLRSPNQIRIGQTLLIPS